MNDFACEFKHKRVGSRTSLYCCIRFGGVIYELETPRKYAEMTVFERQYWTYTQFMILVKNGLSELAYTEIDRAWNAHENR